MENLHGNIHVFCVVMFNSHEGTRTCTFSYLVPPPAPPPPPPPPPLYHNGKGSITRVAENFHVFGLCRFQSERKDCH